MGNGTSEQRAPIDVLYRRSPCAQDCTAPSAGSKQAKSTTRKSAFVRAHPPSGGLVGGSAQPKEGTRLQAAVRVPREGWLLQGSPEQAPFGAAPPHASFRRGHHLTLLPRLLSRDPLRLASSSAKGLEGT